jgi:hypothetical protein
VATDIVERLRAEGLHLAREAADEIERLRAELAVYETAVKDRETALDDRDALIAEALAVTDRAKSDDAIRMEKLGMETHFRAGWDAALSLFPGESREAVEAKARAEVIDYIRSSGATRLAAALGEHFGIGDDR